jgi:hypothetical protein
MKIWELVPVTLAESQWFDTKRKECRRYERVELSLSGRYMLRNHHEYPCWTINISSGGIAIMGVEKGLIGERIVAYFNHIGRVEGMIARNFDKCFAVEMQLRPPKREKLTQVLTWLVNHQTRGMPDRRARERVRPYRRRMTQIALDGAEYRASLIDLSVLGAALNVDAAPPIGSPVTIGKTSARVVRHLATGIAVEFAEPLPADALDGNTEP